MASIYRSDLSLIISTYELYLLQHHLRIDKNIVLYLPFILDNVNNLLSDRYTSYTNRNDFVFIGNGKHHPNTDAIRYLKARIWPLIKKELPETKLHIYGAYLPDAVMKLHDPEEGFIIQGHGAEVSQIMQGTRINLAPLRFGAGLKGKIVDAAYNGCPSVATTIAAEGFEATSWSGSIADDPNEFASAACQLYMDEKEWYLAQKQGFKLIKHFDKKMHFQCLREHILKIKGNLNKHRAQNFIGGMLMHHTMTSTKYMSKWIEEKSLNKK
jgi:glycosyltransferase involved in cell wall biosynthesis